jgi:hypothetical protein
MKLNAAKLEEHLKAKETASAPEKFGDRREGRVN